jgi:hypothetical protein
MSSGPSTRCAPRVSLSGLLLLAFVVAGLFTMHGIQASSSPNDMPGLPVMAAGHVQATHTGAAYPHCPPPDRPAHHIPGHRHPGGQMCMALLVMVAMFVLTVTFVGRTAGRSTMCGPAGPACEQRGRPPPRPSIFHLSVLRQ